MPTHIPAPAIIESAGNKPKRIEEFFGRVRSGDTGVSIARMTSPGSWVEPAQRPGFDEYTVVLAGLLRVEHDGGVLDVRPGEGVMTRAGERVRYSTPEPEGAQYVAVCLPAFAPDSVHRED